MCENEGEERQKIEGANEVKKEDQEMARFRSRAQMHSIEDQRGGRPGLIDPKIMGKAVPW